jgi:hypothetical protein
MGKPCISISQMFCLLCLGTRYVEGRLRCVCPLDEQTFYLSGVNWKLPLWCKRQLFVNAVGGARGSSLSTPHVLTSPAAQEQ